MTNMNLEDVNQVFPFENQKLNGIIKTDLTVEGALSSIEEEKYDLFDEALK